MDTINGISPSRVFLSQPISPDRVKISSAASARLKKPTRRARKLNISIKRLLLDSNLKIVPEELSYGEGSCFPIDGWAPWCYAGMTRKQRKEVKKQYPDCMVSPFKDQQVKKTSPYPIQEFKVTPLRKQYNTRTRGQYEILKGLLLDAATPDMVLSHFRTYLQKCHEEGIKPDLTCSLEAIRECQGYFNVVEKIGDHLFLAQTSMFNLETRDDLGRNTLDRLKMGINPLMKGESKHLRDNVCNYHHLVQEAGPVAAIPEWDHYRFFELYHQFLEPGEESHIDRSDFGADCRAFNEHLYDILMSQQRSSDSIKRVLRFEENQEDPLFLQ